MKQVQYTHQDRFALLAKIKSSLIRAWLYLASRNLFRRVSLVFLSFVVVTSFIINTPGIVTAATKYSGLTVSQKASAYESGLILEKCLVGSYTQVNESYVKSGRVALLSSDATWTVWDPTIIAYHQTLQSDDNVMSCSEYDDALVKGAIKRLGIDPVDYVCSMGATRLNGTNNCRDGYGDFKGSSSAVTRAQLVKYLNDKVGLNLDQPGDEVRYWRSYNIVANYCAGKNVDKATWDKEGGNTRYNFNNPTSGDMKYYLAYSTKNEKPRYPGFAKGNGSQQGDVDCRTYWDRVNQYYPAYKAYMATLDPKQKEKEQSSQQDSQKPPENTTDAKSACVIPGVGWLVCPVTSFLGDITDMAFTFISDSFLRVDPNMISSSSATYTVWSSMRSIANVAFVIAFLIIIFSQLTGRGIANYGIKKMLPRLIIAALLVNISFFICQIAVDLSNILGVSLKQLFDTVGGGIKLPSEIGGTENGNWAGIIVTVLAGTAIVWSLGLSVLIPFLLAALIAFIMVFFILVLRQVLIILLVVISPLAFVAFLLPNTEQWFTKWRKMFVGLLMVFPLIGILFGAANLASNIIKATSYTTAQGAGDDASTWIMKIIAAGVIAIPLFLLPSLLKKSLDAAGNIGNVVNGLGSKWGKGLQNRTANSGVMKSLAAQKAQKRAQIGAGIYSGRNPLSRGRSFINKKLNNSGAYNAVTGNYGTIRGANIDKLEGEETKLAESAIMLKARSGKPGDSVDAQFKAALEKGDVKAALAAQNILMKSGGSGVKSVRSSIASTPNMSGKMANALSSNILQNHGQAAKGKSADVLEWAKANSGDNAGSASMSSISSSGGTWSGLSARELSDQTDDAFADAMSSGGVSAETIKSLSSPRVLENLSDKKRAALKLAVSTQPAANQGHGLPSNFSGGKPPTTPPPPPPPATPPSSTPPPPPAPPIP